MSDSAKAKAGFSLAETVVSTFVLGLIITGGLVALGQATLLSEKTSEQAMADFILRAETETLRAMEWTAIDQLYATIEASGGSSSSLQSIDDLSALQSRGFAFSTKASQLHGSVETGKYIFRITAAWADKSGKSHEESRVLIVTEGGVSAGT